MKKTLATQNTKLPAKPKLALRRETISTLSEIKLRQVAGGLSAAGCSSGEPGCDTE